MSWMHIEDFVRACVFILENKEISGGVNMSAPSPVTNYEFTKTMGSVLSRFAFERLFILKTDFHVGSDFLIESFFAASGRVCR